MLNWQVFLLTPYHIIFETIKDGGLEKLKEIKFYQPVSELAKYTFTIEDYFREHPPCTIKEAMSKIEELTGLKRSEPQVRKFLKSIGIKRFKVGMIPANADIEEQETFKKKFRTST